MHDDDAEVLHAYHVLLERVSQEQSATYGDFLAHLRDYIHDNVEMQDD